MEGGWGVFGVMEGRWGVDGGVDRVWWSWDLWKWANSSVVAGGLRE